MGLYVPWQSQEREIHPVVKPFHWVERRMEGLLGWLKELAFLEILGIVSNIGLLIAVATYIGSEKQRRDAEVLNAWQTITSAYGQSGSGGRIQALEFLNASPGANWRRKFPWVCAPNPLCTWQAESLVGINLSVPDGDGNGVYLVSVQLPNADLGDATLKKINMMSANLKGANLEYADLEGAFLWNANLEMADLTKANLRGAGLSGANLKEASLELVSLEEAILPNVNLADANLALANLEKAKLFGSSLRSSSLAGANLKDAALVSVDLSGANLAAANLQGANLAAANLKNAVFSGANLSEANLWGADLGEAKGLAHDQLVLTKLCLTKLPAGIEIDPNRDCKELGITP